MQSYFETIHGGNALSLLDDPPVGQGNIGRSLGISDSSLADITARNSSLSVPSQVQATISFQNNGQPLGEEDLFVCGKCKQQFIDLAVFLQHKKMRCLSMPTLQQPPDQEEILPLVQLPSLTGGHYQSDRRSAYPGGSTVLIASNQGQPHPLSTNVSHCSNEPMESTGLNLTQRDRNHISTAISDAARDSGINIALPDNGQQKRPRLVNVAVNQADNLVQIQSNAALLPAGTLLSNKQSTGVILADDMLTNPASQTDFVANLQQPRFQRNDVQQLGVGVLSNGGVASLLQQIPAPQAPVHQQQQQPSSQQQVYIHVQPQPEQQSTYLIRPKDNANTYTAGLNLSAAFSIAPLTLTTASSNVPQMQGRDQMMPQNTPKKGQSPSGLTLVTGNSATVPVLDVAEAQSNTAASEPRKAPAKAFSCQYCTKLFTKLFDLGQHVRSHTGEKPFQCIVCGRAFAQKSNVKKHMETHKVWPKQALEIMPRVIVMPREESANDGSGQRPVGEGANAEASHGTVAVLATTVKSCPYCDQDLGSHNERKSHMLRHKDKQVYKCVKEDCEQTFPNLDDYVEHVKTHEGSMTYRCHHCHKLFNTLHNLGVHQYQAHLNEKSKTTKFSKKYACKLCPAKFSLPEMLQKHMVVETHHHECSFCARKFACERYLLNHIDTMHSKEPKKFKCSKCGQVVKSFYYLRSHMLIHTDEKPFKCEVCSAAFNRKDKLGRHMSIHDTTKRFKCPFREILGCRKEFNRPDKLKAHIICHNGVRAHKCSYCPKRYTKKRFKVAHERTHTGEFRCDRCTKAFRFRETLESHHCRVASGKPKPARPVVGEKSTGAKSSGIPAEILNLPEGPMYAIRSGPKRRTLRRGATRRAGLRSAKAGSRNLDPASLDEVSTEESEMEIEADGEGPSSSP